MKLNVNLTSNLQENWKIVHEGMKPSDNLQVWDIFAQELYLGDLNPSLKGTSILFYSGGIESSLSAMILNPDAKCHYINIVDPENLGEKQKEQEFLILEPLLIQLAYRNNYEEVILGVEKSSGECSQNPRSAQYRSSFLFSIASDLGLRLVMPVIAFEKSFLFQQAENLGLKYNSCIHQSDSWCGECFKCFENESYRRLFGYEPSLSLKREKLVDFIGGVRETQTTGVDHFFNDNFSILLAEKISGRKLEEVWGI